MFFSLLVFSVSIILLHFRRHKLKCQLFITAGLSQVLRTTKNDATPIGQTDPIMVVIYDGGRAFPVLMCLIRLDSSGMVLTPEKHTLTQIKTTNWAGLSQHTPSQSIVAIGVCESLNSSSPHGHGLADMVLLTLYSAHDTHIVTFISI